MSETPLRVAVLALSAGSYGGDAYFRSALPAWGKAGDVRFTVFARDESYAGLCGKNTELRVCRVPGLASGLVRFLYEQLAVPLIVRREGYDVVFSPVNTGPILSSVPFVTAVRNMDPLRELPDGLTPRYLLRHPVLRRFTFFCAERAARVVAVSKFVRETLVKGGIAADKIDIIYHGIDDREAGGWTGGISAHSPQRLPQGGEARAASGGPGFVASASKFIRYANLELLFRGFKRMRELGYAGELRFAGGALDRPYESEMRRLIGELGIGPHVRLLGYVPRGELRGLIRDCDVFLFPSTLEACPFTLLEAMREGAAVVATRSEPMPEFCGDAAVLVDPADADAFGREAHRIASDPGLRDDLGRKAALRSGDFRWDENVRRLVDCLRTACGRGRRPG